MQSVDLRVEKTIAVTDLVTALLYNKCYTTAATGLETALSNNKY
jgi:hypothetical protein